MIKVKDAADRCAYFPVRFNSQPEPPSSMLFNQNHFPGRTHWQLSDGLLRGIVVFTVLFLFFGQIYQANAFEFNDEVSEDISDIGRISDKDTNHNATGKTHLHECEHCLIFLLEDQKNSIQLPTGVRQRSPEDFVPVRFYTGSPATHERLRLHRLNNRGPPFPALPNRAPNEIFPGAQNAIVAVSVEVEGTQWRS